MTPNRARAVDFSRGVGYGFTAVVIPLETNSNMWYITGPYTNAVWFLIVTSIPLYIIAMALAYYLYSGSVDWDTLAGFVIRNALSEQNSRIPDEDKAFQKVLIITWLGFTLVLVYGYAGNLTAMFSKPKLQPPIKTLEELLKQNEISWAIEEETSEEFVTRTASPGSLWKLLHNQAELVPQLNFSDQFMYGCYSYSAKMRENRRVGSFCYNNRMHQMISQDFTATGKCNFYLLEEKLMPTMPAMAFQVFLALV